MNLPGFSAAASAPAARAMDITFSLPQLGDRPAAAWSRAATTGRPSIAGLVLRLPGPDGKGSGVCTKWCCDAVSGQNCQFKDCTCPPKRKGFGAIF